MSKILSIRIDDDLLETIETISEKLDRSKSWVIKKVLENYIEDMFDVEEAKKVILNKKDKIISHEEAKKEILSD